MWIGEIRSLALIILKPVGAVAHHPPVSGDGQIVWASSSIFRIHEPNCTSKHLDVMTVKAVSLSPGFRWHARILSHQHLPEDGKSSTFRHEDFGQADSQSVHLKINSVIE
jgi:hypothetical protein